MIKSQSGAAVLAALFLAACAGAPPKPATVEEDGVEIIEVEAEGSANVIEGNLLNTKDASLMKAQRAALEKALGILVTGQMVVSKARLIEDQVFAKTAGYLKDWKVLAEREEGGLYFTRIRARVKLGNVREDLDALGLLIRTKKVGNPRVMILIEEKVDGETSTSKTVETELAGQLLAKGYKVVDPERLAEIRNQDAVVRAARGDEKEAADLAKRFGAEICLAGVADAKVYAAKEKGAGDLLEGMISYRGRLNLKSVKAASGQVVLADSREGTGIDLTEENAAIRCLSAMAKEAGGELAEKLAPALFKGSEVQVVLANVASFDLLQSAVKAVRAADGVLNVMTRAFSKDETVLDVELGWGNGQVLAGHLQAQRRVPMAITEATAYRILADLGGRTEP